MTSLLMHMSIHLFPAELNAVFETFRNLLED